MSSAGKLNYKVGFLSSFDPLDRKALSGVSYNFLKMFQSHFEFVEVVGPVNNRKILKGFLSRFLRKFPRRYNLDHSYLLSYLYALEFNKKLKGKEFDFIFAPRASSEIALLKTDIPIIYLSDATFDSLYGYYEWFSNFMQISIREGNKIEQMALNKAAICIFTSEWAANSAISKYRIDPLKIHRLPFGPNMDNIPTQQLSLNNKQRDVCKLLFLGVEWERKGGAVAFDTMIELKKRGIKSSLTVCGCIPPNTYHDDDLTVIPFLNKNNPEDYKIFESLLLEHHFLIVPTRAECFGVVFAEASAFGIPSLTSDTGGTAASVMNHKNGFRFSLQAKGSDYADKIQEIFSNYEQQYLPLVASTRETFLQEYDWESIARKFSGIILKHFPKE